MQLLNLSKILDPSSSYLIYPVEPYEFYHCHFCFQAYSMEVPTVDHTTLEDQAGKVDREATRIRTEAQRLISTNQVRVLCHFIRPPSFYVECFGPSNNAMHLCTLSLRAHMVC